MQQTAEVSTRNKILETALRLFSREGYLGATTREIAREAGIAEVTIFRHFSSKERLFEEVLGTQTFLPTLRGLLLDIKDMPYRESMAVIARSFLATLAVRKDTIMIMQREMRRYPEKIQKIYHTFIDELVGALASYFAGLQEKGVLREFDTELAARSFFGMFFSFFNAEEIMLRKKYRHVDTDKAVETFVDIFVRGTTR